MQGQTKTNWTMSEVQINIGWKPHGAENQSSKQGWLKDQQPLKQKVSEMLKPLLRGTNMTIKNYLLTYEEVRHGESRNDVKVFKSQDPQQLIPEGACQENKPLSPKSREMQDLRKNLKQKEEVIKSTKDQWNQEIKELMKKLKSTEEQMNYEIKSLVDRLAQKEGIIRSTEHVVSNDLQLMRSSSDANNYRSKVEEKQREQRQLNPNPPILVRQLSSKLRSVFDIVSRILQELLNIQMELQIGTPSSLSYLFELIKGDLVKEL